MPGFFAQQVAAGARIMVVTHARRLRMLTSFTRDLDVLNAALAEAEKGIALGMQQDSDRRWARQHVRHVRGSCRSLGDDSGDPCENCLDRMISAAQFYSVQVIAERRAAVAALGQLVDALSVLEGRKALIHVSDGIQQQGGIDILHYIGQICPAQEYKIHQHYMRQDVYDLKHLIAQANAGRVTFYAIEAAGVRNFTAASTAWNNLTSRPSPENDIIRIANLQSTLFYISHDTGGKAVLNAGDFTPDLAKIGREIRTYYSLGYQPEHIGRGRTHRVHVKVPKKSYQVRFRRTFLHKSPDQQLADRALGVALFGFTENPLAAEVFAGLQSPGSEDRVVVPLEVSVPLSRLTLIPKDGVRRGRLTVVVAAPDRKGKKTVIRKKEIPVTRPDDGGVLEEPYRFGVNVELPPGEHYLSVGIWDDVAGMGSFLGLRVQATAARVGAGIRATPASAPGL